MGKRPYIYASFVADKPPLVLDFRENLYYSVGSQLRLSGCEYVSWNDCYDDAGKHLYGFYLVGTSVACGVTRRFNCCDFASNNVNSGADADIRPENFYDFRHPSTSWRLDVHNASKLHNKPFFPNLANVKLAVALWTKTPLHQHIYFLHFLHL